MSAGQDFFQILRIERDATPAEIRAAYFELARQYHPDANPDPSVREHFLSIQNAYAVLSNPDQRTEYAKKLPPVPPAPEISVNCRYSRIIVPYLDEPQLVYALLELVCKAEPDRSQYPPIHVCLVVDRSTSMHGERIDEVKANIFQFFKLLKPNDLISVVTFSDRADVVIPPSRIADLVRMESRVDQISTGGGTEILSGLEMGLSQLSAAKGMRMVRHMILLTDGHTYGDEQACFEFAKRASREGVTINALGIGHEWNDAFLDRITSLSGGNTLYVTSPSDLHHFLEQKLRSLTMVYARKISFSFEGSPKVELKYAFRINPDIGPIQVTSPISFGNLHFEKSLVIFMEFLLPGFQGEVQKISLAEGRLVMEIPSYEGGEVSLQLNLTREVRPDPEPELPPPAIIEAMSHLSLYRLQDRARQEVASGNIAQATRHLQHLATHLLSQGNRALAYDVLVEAEHIQQNRKYSQEGDKRIKYGTRALLLSSGMESKIV